MQFSSPPNSSPFSPQELHDLAVQRLEIVLKNLKGARKNLARDWAQMTPRQRSSASRLVKEIEQEKQTLLETIEMNP